MFVILTERKVTKVFRTFGSVLNLCNHKLTYSNLLEGGFKSGLGLISDSVGSSGSGFSGPLSSGSGLVSEHLGSLFGVLFLVDMFEKDSFVLVHVTLGLQVKFVVHMFVDFLGSSRFLQQPSENSHPLHPHVLDWSSRVSGT